MAEERSKAELLERAKDLDVEGRSTMNKEELEKAVAAAEADRSSEGTGAGHEASDPHNPNVTSELSSEGQDALAEMGEDSEAAKEADLALDASGPLHLQSPSERIMTGAVSEEHAKEQEEKLGDLPEDGVVGDVSEAGLGETSEEKDVQPEDVIDFPPPLGEQEEATGRKPGPSEQPAVAGTPHATGQVVGGLSRDESIYGQKAQLYTDGLSGAADHNLERAFQIPERLQSNDPVVREAGDQSESKSLQEEKSDEEKREAEEVKGGSRVDDSEE